MLPKNHAAMPAMAAGIILVQLNPARTVMHLTKTSHLYVACQHYAELAPRCIMCKSRVMLMKHVQQPMHMWTSNLEPICNSQDNAEN